MEFAEWVVTGLDQVRSGQIPAGEGLYQAVAAGLGDSTTLDAYMNGGDDAARAALVQAIAQKVTADPAFEQQLRQAAEAAQSALSTQGAESTETQSAEAQSAQVAGAAPIDGAGASAVPAPAVPTPGVPTPDVPAPDAKLPFFKTTNGMLALVAAAVVVVGGGVGLGVGLSGDSGGGFVSALKGTWHCQGVEGDAGSITIGDHTWTLGSDRGTWSQSGDKATITNAAHAGDDVAATGVPSDAGPFDVVVGSAGHSDPSETVHVKGSVTAHKLTLTVQLPAGSVSPSITCTK